MSERPTEAVVDPYDVAQVTAVLAGTWDLMGPDGLADLMARLPGARLVPGSPGRLFHTAVPAGVWVGPEHFLELSAEPVVHQHVVGGVVLRRAAVPPGELPTLLARLVGTLVRDQGSAADATVVLTAARDVLHRL